MNIFKGFFHPQIFINSLVFALPVSLLIVLRASYTGDVELVSGEALQLYFLLVLIFSVLFIVFFFFLYLLSRRKHED